jgi:hypothetical protein
VVRVGVPELRLESHVCLDRELSLSAHGARNEAWPCETSDPSDSPDSPPMNFDARALPDQFELRHRVQLLRPSERVACLEPGDGVDAVVRLSLHIEKPRECRAIL